MSPYPHEHSCRLRDPGDFETGSFRRIVSGGLAIILGKLKGQKTTTAQAHRYPTGKWTEAEARAECKKQGGSFEAASGKVQNFTAADAVDPAENEMLPIEED